MRILKFFTSAILFFFLVSCGPEKNDMQNIDPKKFKEDMIIANKYLNEKEADEIDAYVKHREWNMEKTGTGLRYMRISPGTGDSAKAGMTATIKYKIFLLDGTLCYSSDSVGSKSFLIGQDYVETGLHEGIQMMREGEQARFIIPSHLAHGLLGDWDKIPPRAVVIYEIELLDLK
jgi:FKBP-type peptidyl-prolyl cis-trans isomerase FkpA